MSKHPIVHIEFSAKDREEAAKFYGELFGWKMQHIPEMNYTTFEVEGSVGGGLNPVNNDYPAGTVMVYVGTEDIEATLARVDALGGKVLAPKSEIPGVGWFAIFADSTGNKVGLLQALNPQT